MILGGEVMNKTFFKDSFQLLHNEHLQNILGGSRGDYKAGYKWGKVARNALELWSLFK